MISIVLAIVSYFKCGVWKEALMPFLLAGSGRAKLRLSRGFPGCLACDVIPYKSVVEIDHGMRVPSAS